jgi:hypothetical protein
MTTAAAVLAMAVIERQREIGLEKAIDTLGDAGSPLAVVLDATGGTVPSRRWTAA